MNSDKELSVYEGPSKFREWLKNLPKPEPVDDAKWWLTKEKEEANV